MRKITKGPWHVADNDGAHCLIRGVPTPGMSNGETIAKVWLQDTEYHDANAVLIAMAPELLEMVEVLASECKCSVQERYSGHLVDCSVPSARILIERAKVGIDPRREND